MSVKLKQYDGQNTSISDMAEACPRRKRKRKIICCLRKISLRLQKLVAGFWVWPQGATAFISLCFHLTDKKVLPQGWRHLSKNKQAHHLVFNKQLLFSDPSNRVNAMWISIHGKDSPPESFSYFPVISEANGKETSNEDHSRESTMLNLHIYHFRRLHQLFKFIAAVVDDIDNGY